jgi:hypothetical protein
MAALPFDWNLIVVSIATALPDFCADASLMLCKPITLIIIQVNWLVLSLLSSVIANGRTAPAICCFVPALLYTDITSVFHLLFDRTSHIGCVFFSI